MTEAEQALYKSEADLDAALCNFLNGADDAYTPDLWHKETKRNFAELARAYNEAHKSGLFMSGAIESRVVNERMKKCPLGEECNSRKAYEAGRTDELLKHIRQRQQQTPPPGAWGGRVMGEWVKMFCLVFFGYIIFGVLLCALVYMVFFDFVVGSLIGIPAFAAMMWIGKQIRMMENPNDQ